MAKESFAKLTEDLDKITEQEQIEKSEGEDKDKEDANVEEVVESEGKEEENKEPEKDKKESKEEDKDNKEEPKEDSKEVTEEVQKSDEKEKSDKKKNETEDKSKESKEDKDKKDTKEGKGKEDKKEDEEKEKKEKTDEDDKEKVSKSETTSGDSISDKDLVGTFEAIAKSYENVLKHNAVLVSKVEALEDSLKSIKELVKSLDVKEDENTEQIEKSTEENEELEKSDKEVPEGKAVDFLSKSEDNLAEDTVDDEQEEEKEFNPRDHVKTVTNYFMGNVHKLNPGEISAYRGAVFRVKRGDETPEDVEIFKQIAEISKNSKK